MVNIQQEDSLLQLISTTHTTSDLLKVAILKNVDTNYIGLPTGMGRGVSHEHRGLPGCADEYSFGNPLWGNVGCPCSVSES
jgi:hypothetical protein